MNIGDLLWQRRFPGGICLYLGEAEIDCMDEVIWKICHPTEGYLEDSAYYYRPIEEELRREVSIEAK